MMGKPQTISEFLSVIKGVINDVPLFQNVYLSGELSNFKAHSSGHFYFSLKDDKARINAVMFRSQAQTVLFRPKDGDKVLIQGRLDVYPQSGQIQVYVTKMNLDGLGDLYIQFEALKRELQKRGLFDASYKKAMPSYPRRIAVIAGANSAAHADITKTLALRWPLAQQVDFFALVQGEGAANSLVNAIQSADAQGFDCIILARGGGSIEDLWAFNLIEVVMAVFAAKTPIVVGVGHESDTTLVDYVADLRASTPTAAATMATPDFRSVLMDLSHYDAKLNKTIHQRLTTAQTALDTLMSSGHFKEPQRLFDMRWLALDRVTMALNKTHHQFEMQRLALKAQDDALSHLMKQKAVTFVHQYEGMESRFRRAINESVILKKRAFSDILKALAHLSPVNIMLRGYSVLSKDDQLVHSIEQVALDDVVQTRLADGTLVSKIVGKEPSHD